jgi:MYXO-CTERM domain-containing protein
MLYNTLVGAGGHAALVHLSNADGTTMSAELDNNLVSGTTVATLVEDAAHATVTGSNNWLQTGTPTGGLTASVLGSDPGFNSAGTDDFVPLASSPCVGAANVAVSGLPVAEYYENETIARMYRVRASAKDIGAFEHDTMGSGIGPYGSVDGGVVGTIGSATTDAGTTVVGAGDSGPMATSRDAQSSDVGPVEAVPEDAAGMPPDAENVGGDGGAKATSSSSGCSCRVGAGTHAAASGSWGLIGLAALWCRRRRSRHAPQRWLRRR